MKPFRFAVVGAGVIAGFYLDYFSRRKNKEGIVFAGACDHTLARSQALCAKHGGNAYVNLATVLADPHINAVINLTMAKAHMEVTCQALNAGKHVLTEKPLALDTRDARALVALARRKKLRLSCAPFIVLGAGQQRIRSLLKAGKIGTPLLCSADIYHGRPEFWNDKAERFFANSGGPLFDVGPYPLSLMLHWFGPVTAVRAFCDTLIPVRKGIAKKPFRITVADHISALLEFKSGVIGRVDISNANFRSNLHSLEIHGSTGSMAISNLMDFNGEVQISRGNPNAWDERFGDPKPKPASGVDWSAGIVELARAVRGRREAENSAALGLQAVEVLEAIATSGRLRKRIVVA